MKKLNCKSGNYQCGGRCISGNWKCKKSLNGEKTLQLDNTIKLINKLDNLFKPLPNDFLELNGYKLINKATPENARFFNNFVNKYSTKEKVQEGTNALLDKLGDIPKTIEELDTSVKELTKIGSKANNTINLINESKGEFEKLINLNNKIDGKMIGKGLMGAAYLVKVNNKDFIVKEGLINENEVEVLEFLKEKNVKNVVRLIAKGEFKELPNKFGIKGGGLADNRRIVMDKAEGTPIADLFGEERNKVRNNPNIFKKVKELHNLDVVHGDLHLGNIFYNKNNDEINLIDFGLAKQNANNEEKINDMAKLINQGFNNKNEKEILDFLKSKFGSLPQGNLREIFNLAMIGKLNFNFLDIAKEENFKEFFDIYFKGY